MTDEQLIEVIVVTGESEEAIRTMIGNGEFPNITIIVAPWLKERN